MTTITKESLTRIIEVADEVLTALAGTNDDVHPDDSKKMCELWDGLNDRYAPPKVVMEMARMLLASMDSAQEPIGYMNRFTGRVFSLEDQPGADTDTAVYFAVYTAPPAPAEAVPVVPDELLTRLEFEANHVTEWHHMDEHSCKVNRRDLLSIVNACRAAMLQSGSSVITDSANLITDSANSPVIPDGWVACSERMPDDNNSKPIVIYTGNCIGQGMFVATYGSDGFYDYWEGEEITGVSHWMPLPAAPQQEER